MWLAGTPGGRTNSTLRSAALMRNAIRRARRLTRIEIGVFSSAAAADMSRKAKYGTPSPVRRES